MFRKIIAALAVVFVGTMQAHATSVLPLYLDELVDTAAVAFQGTVLDNRVERDGATGFVVTYTRFAVAEALKGDVGTVHTIKQIGGELAGDTAPSFRIQGVPKFVVGGEYVVFLAGVSSAGFSSPIGLSQGKFNIDRAGATAKVANGRDFRDMTANIPASQATSGLSMRLQPSAARANDAGLDEFKQLVRERAARVTK